MQALGPEAGRKRSLEKEGAHGVIGGANHALSLAVLRGGIWTRHAQLDTVLKKENPRGGVIELAPIVTLDGLDGEAELSGHPGEEVTERGKGLRLSTQRKSPGIMREIINHDEIVFVARNAHHRRCSEVAVDKIKDTGRMRRRGGKRKTNMSTQLARMTQMLIVRPRTRYGGTTTELHHSVTTRMAETAVPGSRVGRGGESS